MIRYYPLIAYFYYHERIITMSVVHGDQVSSGIWEIKCTYCGQVVDRMLSNEVAELVLWLTANSEIVSCFTCDPVGAQEAIQPAIPVVKWIVFPNGVGEEKCSKTLV